MAKARRLIAVFLAAGMLVSRAGLAQGGQEAIFGASGARIETMAHHGTTLYILTQESCYLWDEATGELAEHPIARSVFEREGGWAEMGEAVAGPDGVNALLYLYGRDGGAAVPDGVRLCPLLIGEDGTAALGEGSRSTGPG